MGVQLLVFLPCLFSKSSYAVDDDLAAVSWGNQGDAPAVSIQYELSFGLKEIFANPHAFAAVKQQGRTIVTWGDSRFGGDSSLVAAQLKDIASVAYTHGAFAAIDAIGQVVSWGDPDRGGDSSSLDDSLRADLIVGSFDQFVARKREGGLVLWGRDLKEADIPMPQALHAKRRQVRKVKPTLDAFAAITESNALVSWGNDKWGGNSTSVEVHLRDVVDVVANDGAFAVRNNNGGVVSWGSHTNTYSDDEIPLNLADLESGAISISTTSRAFAAIKGDNTVVAWGHRDSGGDASLVKANLTDVKVVVGTFYAFAALRNDGSVVTWGLEERGGVIPPDRQADLSSGVNALYSNQYAFAAVTNGMVVAWGDGARGGLTPDGANLSGVIDIASTARAFAALKEGGEVITWGDVSYGGDSSLLKHKLQKRVRNVVGSVYGQAFAALVCVPGRSKKENCEWCPDDEVWDELEVACKKCPTLQVPHQDRENFHSICVACIGGSVPSANGSVCVRCNLGEISSNGECVPCGFDDNGKAQIPSASRTTCLPCQPSAYANSETGQCQQCEQNWVPDSTQAYCTQCEGHEFANPGDATCHSCSFYQQKSTEGGCTLDLVLLSPILSLIATVCVIFGGSVGVRSLRRGAAWFFLFKARKSKNVEKLKKTLQRTQKAGLPRSVELDLSTRVKVNMNKYVTLDAVQEIVAEGDLSLVHGLWLLSDSDQPYGRPRFKRKQDLPEKALWTKEDFQQQVRMIVVVAISYSWCHGVHPDPRGEHYAIIKKAVELRIAGKGRGEVIDLAIFFDYMSMTQNAEVHLANPPSFYPPEFKGSRTEEELESFKKALGAVNIPYGNQLVESWILDWTPPAVEVRYNQRAWPTFEKMISSLIKDGANLFLLNDKTLKFKDPEELLQTTTKTARHAPVIPVRFNNLIESKTVTNGGDKALLKEKYTETFDDVIVKAKSLWFANLDWSDFEAQQLEDVFEYLSKHGKTEVAIVLLSGNRFSAQAVYNLMNAAVKCKSLEAMDFSHNLVRREYFEALRDTWQNVHKKEQNNLTLDEQDDLDLPQANTSRVHSDTSLVHSDDLDSPHADTSRAGSNTSLVHSDDEDMNMPPQPSLLRL